MGSFMMLRLTFNSLSIILAIRGTISQQTCCEKKTVNNIEYILSQDEVASNPSCVNGCIYQEADNPSSYACFVHAFNEVGCSVDVDQSNCPSGFKYFAKGNKCYKFYPEKVSWNVARNYCLSIGGDLASSPDNQTNTFLTTLISEYTWIGGYRYPEGSNSFHWTDGSPWKFTDWASGQPNNIGGDQNSVAINWAGLGKWDDEDGDDPEWASPYICQMSTDKCCPLKVVGGIEYKHVGEINDPDSYGCSNGCVYESVYGNTNAQFCFKPGSKSSECVTFPFTTPVYHDLEWCPKGEITIQQNNLLGVIPEWGPAWKISFELNIQSFPSSTLYEFIFRFTSTTNDCCDIGDRIPALFTVHDGTILYATNIGDNGNEFAFTPSIQTGKWYSFEIEQHLSEDQWKNELTVKDDMDQEIGHLDWNITFPDAFVDVSVFAGDNVFKPAEAKIRSFHFSSGDYSC